MKFQKFISWGPLSFYQVLSDLLQNSSSAENEKFSEMYQLILHQQLCKYLQGDSNMQNILVKVNFSYLFYLKRLPNFFLQPHHFFGHNKKHVFQINLVGNNFLNLYRFTNNDVKNVHHWNTCCSWYMIIFANLMPGIYKFSYVWLYIISMMMVRHIDLNRFKRL